MLSDSVKRRDFLQVGGSAGLATVFAPCAFDAARIGLFGSSSGGHVAELLALRPNNARYNAIAFAGELRASMDYVLMRSPISNTFARFENA